MNRSSAHYASEAYANVAEEAAGPRELEARLLLEAVAKLRAVHNSWCHDTQGLSNAVLYNRRLLPPELDAADNSSDFELRI